MFFFNKAYIKLHNFIAKGKYMSLGKNSYISARSIIYGKKKIKIGTNTIIASHSILDSSGRSDIGIHIGNNCIVHEFTFIKAFDGLIKIGNNSTINPFCVIYGCESGVVIGDGVRIASGCSLVANSHNFDNPNLFIFEQGVTSKGIIVEDDVWLGSGVKIIDGVKIGKGSVIGANSVVTKSIPPFSIAVGVPAVVIKRR